MDPLVEGQSQETEQELLVLVTETPDRLRVLVHNDDVTPYDLMVLQSIFMLTAGEAGRVTLEAHTSGMALVAVLPEQDAKYRVGQAHALARDAGVPLTFSLQPE